MVELRPLILIALVIIFSLLRSAISKSRSRSRVAGQVRQTGTAPLAPPTPFQEAAPVTFEQLVLNEEGETYNSPVRYDSIDEEGRRDFYTPRYQETDFEPEQSLEGSKQPKAKPMPRPQASPLQVMPQLTASSLVQAIIAKEILTRPPSARRPFRGRQAL